MIIRYLKLPYQCDATALAEEVNKLTSGWLPHFNAYDYTGNWSAIPLRSVGGRTDRAFAETMGMEGFSDTVILQQCPVIQTILAALPGTKQAARLLKLDRGAIIREHRDRELAFEQGEARLHIPVITHPDVEFWLDGDRLRMAPGECWYINANLPHKLSNPSPVDRIHLVVDILVDEVTKGVFERAPKESKNLKEESEDTELQQRVLEEMLLNPDPKVQEWARNMLEGKIIHPS